MIAIKRNCLEPDELQRVLDGQLPRDEFESAISHLDQCETCREAAETLESLGKSRLHGITGPVPDGEPELENETACHVALQGLLQHPETHAPAQKTPPPFQTLGPYRLLELLGSGGMGAVYLAEHQRLKRQCAIKLLPPERVTQPGWLDRFDREMTTIASLEHTNIVQATDAGHEAGWHYLVMEHLDGLDVGRLTARVGRLEVADACEIVRQAALGLAHIHDSGLVHRDIKPSNLMLTRSGTVKLLDLGLVLDGDDPLSKDDRLTTVGHVMGTMPYMAPEQLADSRDVRPQSDIYSLGATLYRLIAGHPPHRAGKGLASQVLAITNEDAKPLNRIRDDVAPEVVALVAGMLSRDPDKRPASALEVAHQLEPAASQGRLKRLLRNALRKSDSAEDSLMVPLPTATIQNASGGRARNVRWLIGAAASLLIIAAVVVMKIQTDVGTLVVHSDQDDLMVVVKRGDEIVDRLEVNSGADNRTILRKGTYTIEIEGGGKAIRLSDEVVTIGRGSEEAVDVVSSRPDVPIPVPGAASPGPGMVASVLDSESADSEDFDVASTESKVPSPAMQVATPALTALELGTYDGKSLRAWLLDVETGTEVEKIGEAAFGAIGALQNAMSRGVGNSKVAEQVAEVILRRSREYGTLRSELPPIDGSDNATHSQSEYFMWYLTQVFAEPTLDSWFISATNELVNGNTKSRVAVIYCIHRYLQQHPAGYGMGGLGGGGGSPLYSAGSSPTRSKFRISRLMRYCLSLSSPEAWPELNDKDRKLAQTMARAIVMKIPQLSNVGVPSEVYEQVMEEIRAVPPSERTQEELQWVPAELVAEAQPGLDAEIAVDVGGADSGKGYVEEQLPGQTPTPADFATALKGSGKPDVLMVGKEKTLLYQGKPLDHWIDLLERERDVTSIGTALKAVELLTRDAGAEKRRSAASQTCKLARRLGGFIIGGASDPDPSHQFMSFFPIVFTDYMPSPGMEMMSEEFENGNMNSQMAILFTLASYLSGVEYDTMNNGMVISQINNKNINLVEQWSSEISAEEARLEKVRGLRDRLIGFAREHQDAGAAASGKHRDAYLISAARDSALRSAIHLTLLIGEDVQDEPVIRDFVISNTRKSAEVYSVSTSRSHGGFGASQHASPSNPMVIAAVRLADADSEFGTSEIWDYLASMIVERDFGNDRLRAAFETVAKAAPSQLSGAIKASLVDPSRAHNDETLRLFIPFFVQHHGSAKEAGDTLEQFVKVWAATGLPQQPKVSRLIEEAKETIAARLGTQAAEEVTP